ncbi:MAG TPA: metallophosphoesterase [Thermoanaerobaculia bacterium]
MIRALYVAFILLALLGDVRIFLFFFNRFVYGSHREEKSPYAWLVWVVAPLLLALTLMFWPLSLWVGSIFSTRVIEEFAPRRIEEIAWSIVLAKIGAGWLLVAACAGIYWIVDRVRVLMRKDAQLAGTVTYKAPRVRRRYLANDLYDLEVTRHEIFIDDLPEVADGLRIAFVTDTHVAPFVRRDFYREIVQRVNGFDPEVVLFGGDFVSFRRHIPLAAEVLFEGLKATERYAVLGNHDYWASADDVQRELGARGVKFLTNDAVLLRGALPLVGIDEIYRGRPDVKKAFGDIDAAATCIAISHHPDVIDLVESRRVDLLLCGHTHGGQIRLPFFGPIVIPSRHEGEYASGFHRLRNVLMYVSRGIGAIPPVRVLCRPEVAMFTLRRGQRTVTI